MIACMYDPVCYLTGTEYEQRYNISSNVQGIAEKPRIYILAQCPSNHQQILYSQERIEDIIALNTKIKIQNNIETTDKIRIFKGDKPAAQFEAGQQKVGTFIAFLVQPKQKLPVVMCIFIPWLLKQFMIESIE